ncbi:MAG: tetratricopeptide repeat protein [Sphaerochaetaceae bacterium]
MTQNTKNKLFLYIVLAAIVAVLFIPVSIWIKLAIEVVIVALFVFLRRSYMFFAMGAKKLEKKDQKCWDLFKKSINAGLPASQAVYIGTAFIKQGDADYGIKICRDIIAKNPSSKEANTATVTLSMGLWVKGELDEAIMLLEKLRATGYSDKTLDINLSTYLLEKGRVDSALKIISEAQEAGTLTNGMLDNKLWALLLKGRFDECNDTVTELMDERKPRFPEAYLHSAQVMIHQGRVMKAIEYIDSAIQQKFSLNGAMGQQYLEKLSSGLSDLKTRNAYAWAIDQSVALVARGKDFPIDLSKGSEYKQVSESEVKRELRAEQHEKNRKENVQDDLDDDREPNTDLDDDDFIFQDEETTEEDESDTCITKKDEGDISTDVSKDDDREPNTDLG